MPLPLTDPQFWIVSGAAATALALLLRRLLRRPKPTAAGSLPCARCARAGEAGHASARRRPAAWAILPALLVAGAQGARAELVQREVAAMGTVLRLAIDAGDRAAGLAVSAAMVAAVEETERRLSTWRQVSEFATFNAAPAGSPVTLSPLAYGALATALACWSDTSGAFDPTVAPLVEAWATRGAGRVPTALEIEAARFRLGAGRIELDGERLTARQPGGVRLEEGGFGKGAGLDAALAAARAIAPRAHVELDFGGQLAWMGRPAPVEVAVADPRQRSRAALALTLETPAGSLSTSANSERALEVGGLRLGHLLDPRTGRPAEEIGSATVLVSGAAATLADCRSTGLYVLGEVAGADRMSAWSREGRAEALLLLVEASGLRALVTPGLAGRARALVPGVRIQTIGGSS